MLLENLLEEYWGSRAAGVIAINEDGEFLLGLRSPYVNEPNTWGYPGGKLDDGEVSPKNSAKREFKEETGYDGPMTIKLFDTFEDKGFKFYTFIAKVKKFKPKTDWENERFEWVTLDNLPSPLHFGTKRIIKKLEQFLNQ